MKITAFDLAQRYIGIREIGGSEDHPLVQWWLSLCGFGLQSHDEIPWCSAFVNGIAWELRLPRSKSAMARSWLTVGSPVSLMACRPGFDVVIFKRGTGDQPGPDVLDAPGHVGFFAGLEHGDVLHVGGNQSNSVSLARTHQAHVLGFRRLLEEPC